MASEKVHVFGDQYRVKLSLLKPANRTLDPKTKRVVFTNPRKFLKDGKIDGEGMDEESMNKLGDSIARRGLKFPLQTRPIEGGFFEVVDGERRLRRLKKMAAEGIMCRDPADNKMKPADKAYEYVMCYVQEMTDLEAYEMAAESSGVPPCQGATATIVKYLHDCGKKDDEILKAVNHLSPKWLHEVLKIMSLDEFCRDAFLRGKKGGISHNAALKYLKMTDVAARVERCKRDIAAEQEEHELIVKNTNLALNDALDDLERRKADVVIAEAVGGDVEKSERRLHAAESEAHRRKKDADKAAKKPVQVTERSMRRSAAASARSANDPFATFLTKKGMQQSWIIPLEEIVHAGGKDKGGEDLGVDLEDAKFVLKLWGLMCKGEKDIVGWLRKRAAKRLVPA